MIRYTLQCGNGHRFESWFPSSDSYEKQKGLGLVACPECGGVQVEKAVMAPAVARTDRQATATTPDADARPVAETPAPAAAPGPVALMSEPQREFVRLLREMREHVTRTADYVGEDFAGLARKMHEGEEPARSIYGEATPDEVRALREDEVEVFPLPILPEDRN